MKFFCILQVQNLLRRITLVVPQQELEGRSEIGLEKLLEQCQNSVTRKYSTLLINLINLAHRPKT